MIINKKKTKKNLALHSISLLSFMVTYTNVAETPNGY